MTDKFTVPVSGQQLELLLPEFQLNTILDGIRIEVKQAETKFPKWPADLNYGDQIVNEEKGEATQALLDICQSKSTIAEAIREYEQTAAMCVRQIAALQKIRMGLIMDTEIS